ncbi:unnamed protein product [Coregonus sp. 'balchen']|nr:unnamed protein product [Coregonus sp. 'balchen']
MRLVKPDVVKFSRSRGWSRCCTERKHTPNSCGNVFQSNKTDVILIGSKSTVNLSITVDGFPGPSVNSCQKPRCHPGQNPVNISRLHPQTEPLSFLSMPSFVTSRLDYCNPFLTGTPHQTHRWTPTGSELHCQNPHPHQIN